MMHDIVIVGGGAAGLTAAIYARRADKDTLVVESKSYGGQILNAINIENYPAEAHISGFDFATRIYNQAKDLGTKIVFERVVNIIDHGKYKEVITNKNIYNAKTVILATGSVSKKLGIASEEQLVGKGISYCATCDGAFYKNKAVAVVGGGNTALEDALYLSDIASKVYLIHRRDKFRGDDAIVKQLREKSNVEFVCDSVVTGVVHDSGRLDGIKVAQKDGNVIKIEVSGLFVAIGRVPENKNFAKLIDLDEAGYIVAGEDCTTNVKGIYVAGDNRSKSVRQLVTATSDGAIAAIAAVKYINSGD